jgi:hypothetical protein
VQGTEEFTNWRTRPKLVLFSGLRSKARGFVLRSSWKEDIILEGGLPDFIENDNRVCAATGIERRQAYTERQEVKLRRDS